MLGRFFNPSRIAVVEVFGALGSSERTARYVGSLRALSRNPAVRAVVLDIDSPGGTVSASDYLHRSVEKLAGEKPVIAFIRGTGASGAYLASCAATRIVALPTAIVGSIGAISVRPLLYEFLHKLGVGVSVTKAGRLKDMWSMFREPTREERRKEQALLDEFYDYLVSTVARKRHLGPDTMGIVGTGEIFSAERAYEMGLIDVLGDLDTAIELAMQLGNVPRRVVYVRPRRGLRAMLMSRFAASLVEEFSAQFERGLRGHIDFR